jgi:hypothetical protein
VSELDLEVHDGAQSRGRATIVTSSAGLMPFDYLRKLLLTCIPALLHCNIHVSPFRQEFCYLCGISLRPINLFSFNTQNIELNVGPIYRFQNLQLSTLWLTTVREVIQSTSRTIHQIIVQCYPLMYSKVINTSVQTIFIFPSWV